MMESKSESQKVDDLELLGYLLADEGIEISEAPAIRPRRSPQETPLSCAQQRLWTLHQLDPGSPAYNISTAVCLSGRLDTAALESSLNEIVRRHEVLRTCFQTVEGQPSLRILPAFSLKLPVLDLRGLNGEERQRAVEQETMEDARRPFDLERGPMLRARLLRLDESEHVALLSMHHIASDAWSMGVLVRELGEIYRAFSAGKPSPLPELAIQYGDFSAWQRQDLQDERLEEQLAYWRKQLAGLPVLELPTDWPRPVGRILAGAARTFELPARLSASLKALAQQENVTLFMLLLGLFQVLLYRYTQQEDIVVGTPIANRNRREIEPLIGFFVNTLVLRTDLSGRPGFRILLGRVRDVALEAYAHQDLPFEQLVGELSPERDVSRNPLFQVMFTLQNAPSHALDLPGLTISPVEIETLMAKFDLTLSLTETETGLAGAFEYNTSLFEATTIARMIDHFTTLAQAVVADPDQSIAALPILPVSESQRLLAEWNQTTTSYPDHLSIAELFEAQAEKSPDAIALDVEEQILSYRELNQRANRLAHHLLKLGIGREALVGICVEQTADMVVGLLGILKAGGAYVPLNPNYPIARLGFMLENTQARVVLTHEKLLQSFPADRVQAVCLDRDWADIQRLGAENPSLDLGADSLAYVIYTSGSTGEPKGISVSQRAVVRLVVNTNYIDLKSSDRVAQISNFAFDAITFEVWGALLHGACLVGVHRDIALSPPHLAQWIHEKKISVLFLTTALFNQVARVSPTAFAPLHHLLFGGELVDPNWVKEVLEQGPPRRLLHVYGPTETTTYATWNLVESVPASSSTVPIGRPLSNTEAYVLDANWRPLPIGIPGELYLGGDGLARGYLKRPDLTAEKFIPHPFSRKEGERLYRTGDLVRCRADGKIEFLGRIDQQVKIRGFRIEPGEIDSALSRHPDVAEAVVLAHEDQPGNRSLVAYLVPKPGREIHIDEVRDHLREQLPDYMIPAHIVRLDCLPLTPNGKVDKRALPAPPASVEADDSYRAPRNELEQLLADVWESVLGREQIGVDNNYFELGGDSISAIQVVSRLNRAGWQLRVRDLFRNPTIAALAPHLQESERAAKPEVVTGRVPLTAIQRWFFEEHEGDLHHLNQAVLLRARERLDDESLRTVFHKLQEHHDALRMSYPKAGGAVQQVNSGLDHPLSFDVLDLRSSAEAIACLETHADGVQRSFDLEKGPLMKAVLYRLEAEDRILIVIHHLVVDGVSWRILLEDFQRGYRQQRAGREIDFGQKTDSFQHWAQAVEAYSTSEHLLRESNYWSAVTAADATPLPGDGDGRENLYGDSLSIRTSLSKDETENLLIRIHRAYHTEVNDILLTALGRALKRWHGGDQTLVTMEGHGREPLEREFNLDRTVGWFTSLYPFLLKTPGENIGYQIKVVKEALRNVPSKGVGFAILRYVTPKDRSDGLRFAPGPKLSFNYLGQFDDRGDSSLFEFADESYGHPISPRLARQHDLDVVGVVIRGRLELSITFNRTQHRTETINKLLADFKDELLALIEHCRNRTEDEKTPADFTATAFSIDEYESLLKTHSWKGSQIEDIYHLSPMQEGLLFQTLYDSRSRAYWVQMSHRLEGELKLDLFRKSWNELCRRHAVLRTSFLHEALSRPLQVVLKGKNPNFIIEDLQDLSQGGQRERIGDYRRRDLDAKIDLERDAPMRIAVFKLAESQHHFVWSYHHILFDGWSLHVIYRDLIRIYRALIRGEEPERLASAPFSEYIRWLELQDRESPRLYWSSYLSGYEQLATVPRLTGPALSSGYDLQELTVELDRAVTAGVKKLADHYQVTLSTIIQCLWGLILSRYNRVEDVVFGAIVSGRPSELKDVEDMVGLFINAVPVRIRLRSCQPFSEVLREVQKTSLESEPFHYFPLPEIQRHSSMSRDLFDHLLIFQNYPAGRELIQEGQSSSSGFTIDDVEVHDQTHYDLNLIIVPDETVLIKFNYNANVYREEKIRRAAEHLQTAARNVLQQPTRAIKDIPILPDWQHRRVVHDFNRTATDYPRNQTLVNLFENQVEREPGAVAVVYGDIRLTYAELNERANRMAHSLRDKHGIQPDNVVGVLLERSDWLVAAILAILKAGKAYVPIDPDYPAERLGYILDDSNCSIVLSEAKFLEKLSGDLGRRFVDAREVGGNRKDNPTPRTSPDHLAYVIYTSGSTGNPKGCQVEHGNLFHYLYWANQYYFDDGEVGCFGLYSSLSFDLTVTSLFLPLLRGKALHVFPSEAELTDILPAYMNAESAMDCIKLTPSHISLLKQLRPTSTNVRLAIVGGEALSIDQVHFLRSLNPRMKIYNEYGPTETTVGCIVKRIEPGEDRILIGRPIDNTNVYILDHDLQPLPVGIPGEMYIGGPGVSRGYLNRDDLTRERFIESPFRQGDRLYKTGDLGAWLPDGNIEFLGRNDDQVKVRGYRVELGEIENQVLRHESVKAAVVVARELKGGNQDLVAYVAGDSAMNISALRQDLQKTLPDYMIPSYFVRLDEFPLTPNGKINKRALPDPDEGDVARTTGYAPPRSELEKQLVSIWQEVLQAEKIGIDDNFFELGGHSLKAMQIVSRIHKQLRVKFPLRDFFNSPTIARLSSLVKQADVAVFDAIQPAPQQDSYVLSHAQQRLWLMHQMGGARAYNMPAAYLIEAALDLVALRKVFDTLLERHEVLRTAFIEVDGEPKQKIHAHLDFAIKEIDLSALERVEERAREIVDREANTPFDLSQPPLLRVTLVKLGENRHLFILVIHHIVGDGWSGVVLYREIKSLYDAYRRGLPNPLKPLRIQYKDFALWQNLLNFEPAERYWLAKLAGMPHRLRLPYDFPSQQGRDFRGDRQRFLWDPEIAAGLSKLAVQRNTTISNVVLTLFNLFLFRLTNQDDICIGMGTANRNHPDTENLIGFFVNVLPIRTCFAETMELHDLLTQVIENTDEAFEHQDYPFDLLVQKLNPKRSANRQPLFNVAYTFQNIDDVHVSVAGKHDAGPVTVSESGFAEIIPFDFSFEISKFDLTLLVEFDRTQPALYLALEYDTTLFLSETIQEYLLILERFARMVVEAPGNLQE
jgi:amino acid adenylation domain-containing protein/non-ribosomal peptide synthase protein (TIGR01720 family)